jgi:catechol 2,3-dioxygenase-like lactoylglutathione lyase family enzyme
VTTSVLGLAAIIIDCADPGPVARFYVTATGGEVVRDDPDGIWVKFAGNNVIFRRVGDYRPPSWPAGDEQVQVHLDFYVDDLEAACARLEQLGARISEHQPHGQSDLIVMLDPAGRPFCIGPG